MCLDDLHGIFQHMTLSMCDVQQAQLLKPHERDHYVKTCQEHSLRTLQVMGSQATSSPLLDIVEIILHCYIQHDSWSFVSHNNDNPNLSGDLSRFLSEHIAKSITFNDLCIQRELFLAACEMSISSEAKSIHLRFVHLCYLIGQVAGPVYAIT